MILIFFLFLSHTTIIISADEDPNIIWKTTLTIKEIEGSQDTIIFGEATNALDATSPDSYDLPKPPPPIPPSVSAYFTSDFDPPYNSLLQDFRPNTKTHQTWNLSIQWIPQDLNSSSTITISWELENFTQSNYDTIELYNKNEDTLLANMQTEGSYTTTAEANIPQQFIIKCTQNNTNQNSTPFPSMIYLIIAMLMIFVLKYRKRNQK